MGFASYELLDGVVGVSLFVQHGNWYIVSIFVIGNLLVVAAILGSAKFKWKTIETICFILVGISIIMWTRSGPWYATVISTVGVVIAACPQTLDAIRIPEEQPVLVYFGFCCANGLSLIAGKEWSVVERLNPAVCTSISILVFCISLRKYFGGEKPHDA